MKNIIELREEAIKEDKNPEFYLYQQLEKANEEIERLNNEIEILKKNNVNEILKNDLSICAKQYKKSEEKLKEIRSKINYLAGLDYDVKDELEALYGVANKYIGEK